MHDKEALTKDEQVAVHMSHHHGDGLPVDEVAAKMNVDRSTVYRLLGSAEKKIPDAFPILTPKQAQLAHNYTVEGMTVPQIAMANGVSERTVRYMLARLRVKGILSTDGKPRQMMRFDEAHMSEQVVRKW